MRESWPYRTDLRTFARLLLAREKRQVWRDDSLAKAEKMLFVGFLFIRKLIECNKVTDRCAKSSVSVLRGSISRDREVSAFLRDDLIDDINHIEWSEAKVDVHQLADKIVHTWWIFPTTNESSGLAGFIFTTDRKRNNELWLLPTSSIVGVFERFARSPVRKARAERDENGRLTYWRAA